MGVVTVMSTVPGPAAGGLVAVIWVSELTVMAAVAVPKRTLLPR